jgi:2-polyprenyl-6-methoxyphenol hydroxylase-like FAD-dependent oxidoreductase
MGIVDRMIDGGLWITGMRSHLNGGAPVDTEQPDFGLPYGHLGIPQYTTESLLTALLRQHGVEVERGVALEKLDISSSNGRVALSHADGQREEATYRYIIGCDGAHSAVRRQAGIPFEGDAFPMPFMLGDVRIDWKLPAGLTFRSVVLREGGAPDFLFAVPLPDPGHYRISMLSPPDRGSPSVAATDHGIQSETPGPTLDELQEVVNRLIPEKPRLSELRWSSIFRISMRLAARYRTGNVFVMGDAAHIHPPTGGQGMNTGIQDAHNLAWKLALVLSGNAGEPLLESYDSERRAEGLDVVRRTRAASESFGRRKETEDSRLIDTQTLVNYRERGLVLDEAPDAAGPRAGDRMPDVVGMRSPGYRFDRRLHEVLHGIEHVLLVHLGAESGESGLIHDALADLNRRLGQSNLPRTRIAMLSPISTSAGSGLSLIIDASGSAAKILGVSPMAYLIRPDGYVGWRGAFELSGGRDERGVVEAVSRLESRVTRFLRKYLA